jgi:hypothetical protein
MDYVALNAELLAGHPDTGPYNADDQLAADQLNLVNRTRNRTSMTGKEVKDQIDQADWDTRTEGQQQTLLSLFARDDLDPFGIDAHIFQESMTGAVGTSVADLAAYRVEAVSRAVELGFGVVTAAEVETAREV